MEKHKNKIIFLIVIFLTAQTAYGYVASSTNYRIERDSINFAGNRSTSTSYIVEDTLGEIATGVSSSTNYQIKAGYQQMVNAIISISSPSDVTLTPSISGISGGASTGNTSWTVTTDSPGGYILYLKASTSPAMQASSDSFTDYAPSGSVPDYSWNVANNMSEFGFSPEGTHITSTYNDNGTSCGSGSSATADRCWDGFSTTDKRVAESTSPNHPSGTATTVKFQAEVGVDKSQTADSYQAVIIATAVAP